MDEVTEGDLSTERPYCMEVTWKLRDFSRIPANVYSRLLSPTFSAAKADWRLELYPNGSAEDDTEGYIDIYLNRFNFSIAQQRVKTTFSLKTLKGKNCQIYSNNNLYEDNDGWGITKFISRSQLEKKKQFLLPDGTLIVHCLIIVEPSSLSRGASEDELSEIGFSLGRVETGALPCQHRDAPSRTESPDACKGDRNLQIPSPSFLKLQSDYKKLLETEEEADVCLKVSDKEFRAHKCILRARSPVFSAMFQHDTAEKATGEVVIEDLDSKTFPDFLQHVYAGSVDTISVENVFSLYIAADKYDVADLKAECKSYMERTLSVDTFCDVMVLALRYKEDELLKLAIDFFAKNLTKIIVTVKWQIFSKEHNTEANELLIKALVPADQK